MEGEGEKTSGMMGGACRVRSEVDGEDMKDGKLRMNEDDQGEGWRWDRTEKSSVG